VEVLKGVSVDIEDCAFVVLVGPSGCGKSTLLRMIAGLEQITTGEIEIGSRVVNDLPPKERDIARVFQSYALYPHMTVAQNMGFSLKLKRASKTEIAEKVNRAASILGLESLLDRYPRQLSGGQRQRVAMGRAIVRDPQVFLFDEPLSNLDAKLRVAMRAEIKELHQRLKTTTVYVTHDQVEAMTMADRIVVLRGGKVEQIGAPLDLYDRPANAFVAGFIGSPAMNFLEGTLESGDPNHFHGPDGVDLRFGGTGLPHAAGKLTIGVRPEHLAITAPDARGSISAEVVAVEPTGAETVIVVRRGASELMLSTRERPAVDIGERIGIGLEGARLHHFGPDGMRIEGVPAVGAA
jgi:multiple sugar transport system ATP-binding protein